MSNSRVPWGHGHPSILVACGRRGSWGPYSENTRGVWQETWLEKASPCPGERRKAPGTYDEPCAQPKPLESHIRACYYVARVHTAQGEAIQGLPWRRCFILKHPARFEPLELNYPPPQTTHRVSPFLTHSTFAFTSAASSATFRQASASSPTDLVHSSQVSANFLAAASSFRTSSCSMPKPYPSTLPCQVLFTSNQTRVKG